MALFKKVTGSEGKIMKKLVAKFFGRLAKFFGEEQEIIYQHQEMEQVIPSLVEEHRIAIEVEKKVEKLPSKPKKQLSRGLSVKSFDPRDVMELMEVPFLALSKNRTAPINYESTDGSVKVKISCHTGHYVASIYDWDIVLFAASKMQEVINSGSDIPPRTLIVPRHELLKALHKQDGKKEKKDLKASLSRLRLTGIETTIRNEDGRYDAGFGFLDSWGYTERKDIKEIKITLSQWLYDGICKKGSLLKVSQKYFTITSGLKKFLYRTARKHVGKNENSWDFSIEKLYEKSGSEREFKKFKHDLKKVVNDNDLPGYFIKWMERDGKVFIRFQNIRGVLRKSIEE
jgi:plasmid replication initiation protein